ncbi:unnamed protein product [Closterium sp. NIES-64]|nr:unnamed protein product [Closterium sp. NIES-64]
MGGIFLGNGATNGCVREIPPRARAACGVTRSQPSPRRLLPVLLLCGGMDGSSVVAREAESESCVGCELLTLYLRLPYPPAHALPPVAPFPHQPRAPLEGNDGEEAAGGGDGARGDRSGGGGGGLPWGGPPRAAWTAERGCALVLHWKATTGKRLRVAVVARAGTEAAAAGWFAVGWSPKGGMDGSNVVAREADSAPIAYDLSGNEDATESRTWVVQDASVEHTDRGIIMRFTRTKGDGSSVGIRTWEGLNYIVFAYGLGTTIGDHQYSSPPSPNTTPPSLPHPFQPAPIPIFPSSPPLFKSPSPPYYTPPSSSTPPLHCPSSHSPSIPPPSTGAQC